MGVLSLLLRTVRGSVVAASEASDERAVETKAWVNRQSTDRTRRTALHHLMGGKQEYDAAKLTAVAALLASGADANRGDAAGETPRMYNVRCGSNDEDINALLKSAERLGDGARAVRFVLRAAPLALTSAEGWETLGNLPVLTVAHTTAKRQISTAVHDFLEACGSGSLKKFQRKLDDLVVARGGAEACGGGAEGLYAARRQAVLAAHDEFRRTALSYACHERRGGSGPRGWAAIVAQLLTIVGDNAESVAFINQTRTPVGDTALHELAMGRPDSGESDGAQLATLAALLVYGADATIADQKGYTPLYVANFLTVTMFPKARISPDVAALLASAEQLMDGKRAVQQLLLTRPTTLTRAEGWNLVASLPAVRKVADIAAAADGVSGLENTRRATLAAAMRRASSSLLLSTAVLRGGAGGSRGAEGKALGSAGRELFSSALDVDFVAEASPTGGEAAARVAVDEYTAAARALERATCGRDAARALRSLGMIGSTPSKRSLSRSAVLDAAEACKDTIGPTAWHGEGCDVLVGYVQRNYARGYR